MDSNFLEVETEVGDYYLNLVDDHEQEIDLQGTNILEWPDAVILESGEWEYENLELGDIIRDRHYRRIFKTEDGRPELNELDDYAELADIYLVDMPSKEKDLSEIEINLGLRAPAAIGLLISATTMNPLAFLGSVPLLALHTNRISTQPELLISNFYNTIGMRSAIAAE